MQITKYLKQFFTKDTSNSRTDKLLQKTLTPFNQLQTNAELNRKLKQTKPTKRG